MSSFYGCPYREVPLYCYILNSIFSSRLVLPFIDLHVCLVERLIEILVGRLEFKIFGTFKHVSTNYILRPVNYMYVLTPLIMRQGTVP